MWRRLRSLGRYYHVLARFVSIRRLHAAHNPSICDAGSRLVTFLLLAFTLTLGLLGLALAIIAAEG